MTDLEEVVEKEATELGRLLGWLVRKVKWIGRRGAPDKLFGRAFDKPCSHCGAHGRVILMEFKRKGKRPEGQQKEEIKKLRKAGFEVYVVDDLRIPKRVLR